MNKFIVCIKATEDNIKLELAETADLEKVNQLLILNNNLWQGDDEVRAIARKFDLGHLIGFKLANLQLVG